MTQCKSSSPVAHDGRNPPRVTGSMGPPPPRSIPLRRNSVQVGLDSARVLKMKDTQQFNENMATNSNGAGTGSAQNVREYHVERPVHVNPTHDIYRKRMPVMFYVNPLYPHFDAVSMIAHHAEADRTAKEALQRAAEASAPFNQECNFPQSYGPGCLFAPAIEPKAYMQHYGGDQNIGTCSFPPAIPLENKQGSSFFIHETAGNEIAPITHPRSGLKELALLPGCEVSTVNDDSDQEDVQEQKQKSTIVEDVVCIGARSGVGRPEAQCPAAKARRGGSGFQSAQNLSLSLFQPHPAVARLELVIPDSLQLPAPKKETDIGLSLTISPNEAINLAGANSRHHFPTRAAISAPTLTAPKIRRPLPPKSDNQIIQIASDSRMAANLSAAKGDTQRTALKNSRFMKPILDILHELCHLKMVQQTRNRPGRPPVQQLGIRLIVEGMVFEPANPRLGSTRAAPPGRATGNLPVPLRLYTASIVDLEAEKQKLLKMLEELTSVYMLHTERLTRLTKQFNAQAGEGMAELYSAIVQLTLTRNFGALKGAIVGRLRAVRRALGEDIRFLFNPALPGALVPQASNIWRPHRGLPGIAVGILRGWLFEHFLHPYPQDKDKKELARQTGLSKSQVSNWFINARVRLWKPMVEAMYKDEVMGSRAEEREREITEPQREVPAERIGKLLDMNRNQACMEVVEDPDHSLTDDHTGLAGIQQHPMHLGVNEVGLIHAVNGRESSSSCHSDIELEMFLTMPEEFAHVDKRMRPGMPLKICKLEPKDI